METDLLLTLVGSSLVFFALLVWKMLWFYKKVIAEQKTESSNNQSI